jgi:sporulation protein YlmC with PRC-barrel domain
MNPQQVPTNVPLEKLNDTGLALADPGQDIRGRKVVDRDGAEIGHVSNLFIDQVERKVRMLEIRAGGILGLGDKHFLLPVDAISKVGNYEVTVGDTRERVIHSPVYDPALIEATVEYIEPYYGYYGHAPFWGPGYLYPGFPVSGEQTSLHDSPVRTRST